MEKNKAYYDRQYSMKMLNDMLLSKIAGDRFDDNIRESDAEAALLEGMPELSSDTEDDEPSCPNPVKDTSIAADDNSSYQLDTQSLVSISKDPERLANLRKMQQAFNIGGNSAEALNMHVDLEGEWEGYDRPALCWGGI